MSKMISCIGCGKELHHTASTCPGCGADQKLTMIPCVGCAKEIHYTASTCPGCGAVQPEATISKKGFNWIALFFPSAYYAGKGHFKKGLLLAFLGGLPVLYVLVPIYAGLKANKEITDKKEFNWGKAILAFFLQVMVLTVVQQMINSKKSRNRPDTAPVTVSNESIVPPTSSLPTDEDAFIQVVQTAQSKSHSAINDMQKGGIKAEREKGICKIIKGEAKNWVGKIIRIDANSDGKGVLEIEIAEKIKVKTWDNAFSDTGDDTLLSPDSEIFKTASAMKVGQSVKFSGAFFRGEDGACLKEGSITLDGKITDPEFIFRFSKFESL